MQFPDARELDGDFGDALAKAFELVVTPAIFGFLGYLLDRWLSTTPVFTIAFTVTVLAYMVWKLFVSYDAAMQAHSEGKPWARREESGHG